MQASNKAGWLVAVVLLAAGCGGKVETGFAASSDSGGAPTSASGGATSTDPCADAGIGEGGCDGEDPLDPSLRSACERLGPVRRSGTPVSICFHIR